MKKTAVCRLLAIVALMGTVIPGASASTYQHTITLPAGSTYTTTFQSSSGQTQVDVQPGTSTDYEIIVWNLPSGGQLVISMATLMAIRTCAGAHEIEVVCWNDSGGGSYTTLHLGPGQCGDCPENDNRVVAYDCDLDPDGGECKCNGYGSYEDDCD